jgi:hypothetical protein
MSNAQQVDDDVALSDSHGANEHSRSPRAGALDRAVSDSSDPCDGASSIAAVLAGRRLSG